MILFYIFSFKIYETYHHNLEELPSLSPHAITVTFNALYISKSDFSKQSKKAFGTASL